MIPMVTFSNFQISDVKEGQVFFFEVSISEKMIDDFATLTGDLSPLHMNRDFALVRGFKDRVVHGALLSGLVSRLVGVHLPGSNCLLHSMNMRYLNPTYAGDHILICGKIDHVSVATKAISVQVIITNINSQTIVSKGKVSLGFTEVV